MPEAPSPRCDIAIAGGGLAGCLIALALAARHPALDIRLIEPETGLGGNHIWSFFDSDVAPEHRWLVEPLICHRWSGYDIAFPAHARTLDAAYNSITSDRLDAVAKDRLAGRIIPLGVTDIQPKSAGGFTLALTDQSKLTARLAIDARGPGDLSALECGWQKFVGQRLTIKGGHGLIRPIVMDATVEQIGGYRFVYCLPLDADTVFVEDTYYADTPALDVPAIRTRIADYAAAKGWAISACHGEETGVLPVVIGGDHERYLASTGADIPKAGLRAGLFHATTGYSLPNAVRLAIALAENPALTPEALAAQAKAHWRTQGYYRMLDVMLFHAAEPDQRYKILERFYRLSPALIGRFYAGQSTWADKIRVLAGKPPVPITRAIRALWEQLK